jgi:hypothetical protein
LRYTAAFGSISFPIAGAPGWGCPFEEKLQTRRTENKSMAMSLLTMLQSRAERRMK